MYYLRRSLGDGILLPEPDPSRPSLPRVRFLGTARSHPPPFSSHSPLRPRSQPQPPDPNASAFPPTPTPTRSTPFCCHICLRDEAAEPVVTLCGHLYCWSCLYLWASRPASTFSPGIVPIPIPYPHLRAPAWCPVCRAALDLNTIIPVYTGDSTTPPPPPTRRRSSLSDAAALSTDRGSSPSLHAATTRSRPGTRRRGSGSGSGSRIISSWGRALGRVVGGGKAGGGGGKGYAPSGEEERSPIPPRPSARRPPLVLPGSDHDPLRDVWTILAHEMEMEAREMGGREGWGRGGWDRRRRETGGGDVLMVQRLLLFVGCVLLTFAILFL